MISTSIPQTLKVLCKQIQVAEDKVRSSIHTGFPRAVEEQITTLFQLEVGKALKSASRKGEIAKAFAADLDHAGFSLTKENSAKIADGLIAEVSWHPRNIEEISCGDFGIVLVRPKIVHDGSSIRIIDGVKNGLLVQAKRKLFRGRLGRLTANQEMVLPHRFDFTSLLLYRFSDSDNRELGLFNWRSCKGASLGDVKRWLSKAANYDEQTSTTSEVLHLLESGKIGTSDEETVDTLIAPPGAPTISIEVKWKKGKEPRTRTFVLVKPKQKVHVYVNR